MTQRQRTAGFGFIRALAAAAVAAAALIGPAARADDFVDKANHGYKQIRQDRRSDLVLLPVLAKMEAPPASVDRVPKAILIFTGSAGWPAAEAWATGAPQKAVIEALKTITKEEDPKKAFVFAQPYGSEGVPIELIRAGLYTDLGDPPMLAAAKIGVMPALNNAACLVNVEATRLAAAGQPELAIDLLVNWVFFARQMCDRQMFEEVTWGQRMMIFTLDRLRDVVYQDFRSAKPALTVEGIAKVLVRLRDEGGYIGVERMAFPQGERYACEQVIDRVFLPRGGPNMETFAATMSMLATTKRPLRLFAESAKWDQVATLNVTWFDAQEQLKKIYDDWTSRWPLGPFDRRMALRFEYDKMNKAKYAVVAAVVPDMSVLFNNRQVTRTQIVGTRASLGVVAFSLRHKAFPPTLAAIRPAFLKRLDADPFNPNRERGAEPPLEYFVPIRDQKFSERETPRPHTMNVFPTGTTENFKVSIGKDQFIVYSVGPNGAKEWADRVSAEPAKDAIGDMLIWPPVISLARQNLIETGQLK